MYKFRWPGSPPKFPPCQHNETKRYDDPYGHWVVFCLNCGTHLKRSPLPDKKKVA